MKRPVIKRRSLHEGGQHNKKEINNFMNYNLIEDKFETSLVIEHQNTMQPEILMPL